jgi:hypothetical protein
VNADVPRPCGEPAAVASRLDAYHGLRMHGRYWVEVTFDGREWVPAQRVATLPHHAARPELTNVTDFAALDSLRGKRLRLTLEITGQDVRAVAGRPEWRDTISARIVEVCSLTSG